MNNGTSFYERIIKVPNRGKHLAKKISLAMSYLLLFSIFVVAALNNIKSALPLLVVGALLTFAVAAVSWKYLQLEYEYSFSYGVISVSKIYGKKKRKTLVSAEIKELMLVAPATDESIKRAEGMEIDERVIAVSSEEAENIWLLLTGGKDKKRTLLFFEADERSLAILKGINPFVFSKR